MMDAESKESSEGEEVKAKKREQKREKNRNYREANPEKARESVRKYREANPEKAREQGREQSRNYREANPEKVREQNRKYYEANPEKSRERGRKYYEANPEKVREAKLKRNFGISVETYEQMLAEQNNACWICEKGCSSGRRLAVDHCHKTGKVRGLLCTRCNTALGKFEDDPALLKEAMTYLFMARANDSINEASNDDSINEASNESKVRKTRRRLREDNPEKEREQEREQARDAYLKRNFGISIETYEKMLAEQNNGCWICKKSCSSGNRLAVDHCHKTGKVRGLLCTRCNTSLGKFEDSIALLKEAMTYLYMHHWDEYESSNNDSINESSNNDSSNDESSNESFDEAA